MVTFCAACDRTEARLDAVGADRGKRAAERTLPNLPEECRILSRAGVREGDRQDVAVLKYDAALSLQHGRTIYCAEWYDQLRAGLQSSPPVGAQ
jgi:hypothetical protein